MRRVIIESPYGTRPDGSRCSPEEIQRNKLYLQRCIRDCLNRGESPYASHQMLTEALDDENRFQRALGFAAGLAWYQCAEAVVFYLDHGASSGMHTWRAAIERWGLPIEERYLDQ